MLKKTLLRWSALLGSTAFAAGVAGCETIEQYVGPLMDMVGGV